MSQTTIFDVEFRVVKLNPAGQVGPTYSYIKPSRRATVAAASQTGILAVLQADVPVNVNEVIEVLSARQGASTGETVGGTILS